MSSINRAILFGRIGEDPEAKSFPNGGMVVNAIIATSENYPDKSTGEKKKQTEWHRLSFFNKSAENASKYLKKGDLIYLEGKIKTRKWQDKDGQDRYTTEIIVDMFRIIASSKKNEEASEPAKNVRSSPKNYNAFEDDDIPF